MTHDMLASERVANDLDRMIEAVQSGAGPLTECPACKTRGRGTWVCGCPTGGGWTVVRAPQHAVRARP